MGTETEVVPLDVTVTRHGPVVLKRGGDVYALRWTALSPATNEFTAFYKLNRARNWKEFQEALKDYGGATQNFIYADVDGHIGYYGAGQIPVRASGDGSVPYDGSKDEGEWKGFIPFAELPHVYDPPSGMIVTANSRIVGTSYTHFLTHLWAPPSRARRIYELLDGQTEVDGRRLPRRAGRRSTPSPVWRSRVRSRVSRTRPGSTRRTRSGVRPSASSNRGMANSCRTRAHRDLPSRWPASSARRFLKARSAPRWRRSTVGSSMLFDRVVQERPAEWLPKEYKTYAELFDATHREARESLAKRYGADETKWVWGVIQVNFPHPLASVPGIGKPFQVAPFPQKGGGGLFAAPNVGASVSMRLIADASDWDKTQHGIALGESGDPRSPHWADQLSDWRASTPRVFPFTTPAVAAAARRTQTLAPK